MKPVVFIAIATFATFATFATVSTLSILMSCSADEPGKGKSSATVRAARRAFDGAPPVIPHAPFGVACTNCHNERGMAVPGVGFAPPTPHGELVHGALRRCQQCHVQQQSTTTFKDNGFVGLAQDLRRGKRLNPLAPPVIPHQILMRENCAACHTGPAAREPIRCTHPERAHCLQCHVEQKTETEFVRPKQGG